MTQTSLHNVTLQTVANYRHAAQRAVGAYRAGGHRLIAVVQQGVDEAATRGAEPYVPGLAAALRSAGHNVTSLATQGVDAVSSRTERAIELGATGMTQQIKRAADLADGVDNRYVARGLQAAARISLPGAQAALAISERLAAGADKLASVAAGPVGTQAKTAAQRVRRSANKVAKAAATTVSVKTSSVVDALRKSAKN